METSSSEKLKVSPEWTPEERLRVITRITNAGYLELVRLSGNGRMSKARKYIELAKFTSFWSAELLQRLRAEGQYDDFIER